MFVCLFLLLFVSSDPQDVFRLVVCLHGVFSPSSAVRTLRLSDFSFVCLFVCFARSVNQHFITTLVLQLQTQKAVLQKQNKYLQR